MKISRIQKIITTLIFLSIPSLSFAWAGFDYGNKTEIDIDYGNLVRTGLLIQFYDDKSDNFHSAQILFIEALSDGTRIQVLDLETNEERTFIMEKEE